MSTVVKNLMKNKNLSFIKSFSSTFYFESPSEIPHLFLFLTRLLIKIFTPILIKLLSSVKTRKDSPFSNSDKIPFLVYVTLSL